MMNLFKGIIIIILLIILLPFFSISFLIGFLFRTMQEGFILGYVALAASYANELKSEMTNQYNDILEEDDEDSEDTK